MSGLRPASPLNHLKYDVAHGFIKITPGEFRTLPAVAVSGPFANVYQSDIIHLLVAGNPKEKRSQAYKAFALYRDQMTVGEFVAAYNQLEFLRAFNDAEPIVSPGRGRGRNDIMPGIDRHGHWARRAREILGAHVNDLGGLDALSEAEKSVLRRVAVLSVEAERLERRFAAFPPDHVAYNDLNVYTTLCNTLRRMLDLAGLERRTKSITPTIDEYLNARGDVIREAAE